MQENTIKQVVELNKIVQGLEMEVENKESHMENFLNFNKGIAINV